MRRAGSPEGLLVRVCDSFPCSAAETSFRELDDAFLQSQTRIWLGEVLHMRFEEETTIADLLADGELLFQVSKVVWKMLLKKCVELEHSNTHIYERTSSGKNGGRYMPYPKVDSFLKICQILGLTGIDLFSPSDVVDKRDTRRVCMCIRSLSKKARLKDLNVPDFDVVTYTIAMPTDMVGCIRRNLEQSQCSSSSSNICSPSMDLREIYRQKYVGSYTAWQHDSCSEPDEAESAFRELDSQSPESNTSYGAENLSSLIGANSPGGNSVVEENFGPSQNLFKLDHVVQDDMAKSPKPGESFLAGSCHLCFIRNGNCQFTNVHHCRSSPSSSQGQIDLDARTCFAPIGGINWTSNTPKTIIWIHDVDCSQPCASSTGDSPSELDLNGETCNCSMLCNESLENCVSKRAVLLESLNVDCGKEEYTEVSRALFGSEQVDSFTSQVIDTMGSDCSFMLEEIPNEGCRCMLELNDERPKCSETTGFPDMACESTPPKAILADTEGKIKVGDHNVLNMTIGSSVDLNTSLRSYLQLGTSDPILQNMDNKISALSDTEVVDDMSGVHVEIVHPNCGDLGYDLESKSVNEVRDTEVSSTASLNYFSGNAVSVVCEGWLDACNICSIGTNLQVRDIQGLAQKKQGNFTLDTSMKKLSDDSVEVGVLTSEWPDIDLNEKTRDLASPKKDNANAGAANLDKSSHSGHESQDAFEFNTPIDHLTSDTCEEHSDTEIEDMDSTESLPSTTETQACSLGIQNHVLIGGYYTTSEDERFSSTSWVKSDNVTVSTAAVDMNTNEHLDISLSAACFHQINVALEDEKYKTTENLAIEGRKSCSCIMDCLEHDTMSSCCNRLESQPMAGESNPMKEGKVKNMLVSQNRTNSPHPCATCNDMPVGVKQDCPMEPCVDDGLSGCLENKLEESMDCTIRSEVVTRSCSALNKIYIENLSFKESSDEDKSFILDGNFLGVDQHDLIIERQTEGIPLFVDISCQGPMQETKFNVPDSKSFPLIADGKASVGTLHHYVDQIEAHGLQTGGMEVPSDFRMASHCSSNLDETDISNMDQETHGPDCASVINSIVDTVHSGSVPSISSSLLFNSEIVQTQESLSSSTSHKLERESNADKSIGVEDHDQPLVDEDEASMKYNIADYIEDPNDLEKCEMDLKSVLSSDRRDIEKDRGRNYKPGKNMLLKSFAGGMTLLGTVFLLLHLRGKGGKEHIGKTAVHLQSQKRSQQSSARKGVELGGVDVLYPGERFNF